MNSSLSSSLWLLLFTSSVLSFEDKPFMYVCGSGMPKFFLEVSLNPPQHHWLFAQVHPSEKPAEGSMLVGAEGFRSSRLRTAKPLWLLLNPLQHIMCIMAAQWAFVTSRGWLMQGCLVHISLRICLSNAVSPNLSPSILFPSTVSLLCSSPCLSLPPFPLSDGRGGR